MMKDARDDLGNRDEEVGVHECLFPIFLLSSLTIRIFELLNDNNQPFVDG